MNKCFCLYSRSLEEFYIMGVSENNINKFEVRKPVVLNFIKVITIRLKHVSDTTYHHQVILSYFPSIG